MNEETEGRLNTMCNLSEVVLERGIERGIEQGQRQLIEQMIKNGKTAKEIADFCGISIEAITKIQENNTHNFNGV